VCEAGRLPFESRFGISQSVRNNFSRAGTRTRRLRRGVACTAQGMFRRSSGHRSANDMKRSTTCSSSLRHARPAPLINPSLFLPVVLNPTHQLHSPSFDNPQYSESREWATRSARSLPRASCCTCWTPITSASPCALPAALATPRSRQTQITS